MNIMTRLVQRNQPAPRVMEWVEAEGASSSRAIEGDAQKLARGLQDYT